MRAFDVWVHEQDLRTALGRPGNLDSPGAHVTRDMLLAALPKVVAKDAGAPRNSAVVFDVHGPLEFLRTVRVDVDGRGTLDSAPSLGPAATPRARLGDLLPPGLRPGDAGGGRRPRSRSRATRSLTAAILRHFAVTP